MIRLLNKNSISIDMCEQIADLYKQNYKHYHYRFLCNSKCIKNLMDDAKFDFVTILKGDNIIGFAGFYFLFNVKSKINEIKLSHLLVDSSYRGRGFGSSLENYRLEAIDKIKGDRIIYASCVEKPYNSISMKINRGFVVSGYRYNYRPVGDKRESSVILTKTNIKNKKIHIASPSKITRKILQKGNSNITFINNQDASTNYVFTINTNSSLGRRICTLVPSTEKLNYQAQIHHLNYRDKYTAIHVSPFMEGFPSVDDFLIKNRYLPISYIPSIENESGILEYQYIPNGIQGILCEKDISPAGRELLESLI